MMSGAYDSEMPVSDIQRADDVPSNALPERTGSATTDETHGRFEKDSNSDHSVPSSALEAYLYPSDSFTADRVYWADLKGTMKSRWITKQYNDEAKRELKVIGRMFKKDPLSPFTQYMSTYALSGMGLFVEGFTLFSVGNLTPLFKAAWPTCWKTHEVCDANWIAAVEYLEILGIIAGQVCVGIEADWIGRKFGMVQDALVMTLGSVMLTSMWGTTLNGWVICYAWSLFVYGFGVGGEYPCTAGSNVEGSGPGGTTADRMHRGRKVQLAFTMQGVGQLVNLGLLIILLLIFHHGSLDAPISVLSAQWTFRVQFAFIAVLTLWLAYYRYYKMHSQDETLKAAKLSSGATGYDVRALKMATSHYWPRMVGTAGSWLCNDFQFYGAKLFSNVFVSLITGGGDTSLQTTWLYGLINVGVSLVGYYLAALMIDHKLYGRKWMQANGFMASFVLYIIAAAAYPLLVQKGQGVKWFQTIYFLSSFFQQFGPNATTFLLAAEVYPSSVRATAHGFSAACGKLGALLPAIIYNYVDDRTKLWIVVWFGLIGWLLTLVFVPDTTGLDLREQERYFAAVRRGEADRYHGLAVHPRHLSMWERVVNKRHLAYDPDADRSQKIDELKEAFERAKAAPEGPDPLTPEQKDLFDLELEDVFRDEKKLNGLRSRAGRKHESKLAALENRLR